MTRLLSIAILFSFFAVACRSTKKIQTAISKKDTVQLVRVENARFDSLGFIRDAYSGVVRNRIDFNTFSAKIKVDYRGGDGKSYDFNAFLRMRKDSVIWVSINAALGIEAFRVVITPDSVKVLNKLDKIAQLRSVNYLQEVTQLPFDFYALQDLIIGNPLYLDSNIVSFKRDEEYLSLMSMGKQFKHYITVGANDYLINSSKLDDAEMGRSRTAVLSYGDYETKDNIKFATKRKISVAEQSKLDISLEFKQFNFNENLNYPFSVPKNYRRD
ncbi:MAG TPA: DUF4292 domain-containing protein [Chitinophagaceae bacterium]|nr:DUF4292 domain-containing protein [Chitinophagaceae bacterium]